eukprot:TRINITY_DN16886_c0_g1_i1.p1 TRINITY_DN16886_c0_g1~~TRINITY_DN16886_c0_g1_i1.p1  ORF type:complete len:258 (+),score=35.14 TRINITY_DN16886_c0_g1_i1:760-1533(+)
MLAALFLSKSGPCGAPEGQNVIFTICFIVVHHIGWCIASIFMAFRQLVESSATATDEPATRMALVMAGFQATMGLCVFVIDLLARQVVAHKDYLERPALCYSVLYIQLIFLQAFMLGTVIFSTTYFFQLIVIAVQRVIMQSSVAPIAMWYVKHKLKAFKEAQREEAKSSPDDLTDKAKAASTDLVVTAAVATVAIASLAGGSGEDAGDVDQARLLPVQTPDRLTSPLPGPRRARSSPNRQPTRRRLPGSRNRFRSRL